MKYSIITKKYNLRLEETIEYPVVLPDTIHHRYFGITNGQLIVHQSFLWDGSSIPGKKLLNKITFGMYDGDRYCKDASCAHDANCQLIYLGFLDRKHKDKIDRLYEKMCIDGATKIIQADAAKEYIRIRHLELPDKKQSRKLNRRYRQEVKRLKRLPAWAARRYWAVKHFGLRNMNPRYYPEKVILDTKGTI